MEMKNENKLDNNSLNKKITVIVGIESPSK